MGSESDYRRVVIEDGRVKQLSASTITSTHMCWRKTYFAHIEGVREQSNGAAVRGTATDAALQHLMQAKADGRKVSVKDAIEFGVSVLEGEVKNAEAAGLPVKWKDEEEGSGDGLSGAKWDVQRGVGQIWDAPDGIGSLTPHPDAPVQDSFEVTLRSGVTLIGTVDFCSLTERGGYKIHDLKTSGRKWPKGKEDASIQPVVYTLGLSAARGETPEGFDFRVATFNKTRVDMEVRVTNVTKARLKQLPMIVDGTAKIIEGFKKGELPLPTGYLSQSFACSYCGYRERCRADGLPV